MSDFPMTDRLKAVFGRARQHAERFNHEYISTEHVLLGLIEDANGIGSYVLREFCELSEIKSRLEALIIPGEPMITMGKLPQTPRLKRAMLAALEFAKDREYMNTEDLLVGLLSDPESVAGALLKDLGVTKDAAVNLIASLISENLNAERIETRHVLALLLRCQDSLDALTKNGSSDLKLANRGLYDCIRWLSEWRLSRFSDAG